MTWRRHKARQTAAVLIAAVLALSVPGTAHAIELSQPQYQVIRDRDVAVPMRDGSHLMADVFRPDGAGRFKIESGPGVYDLLIELDRGTRTVLAQGLEVGQELV